MIKQHDIAIIGAGLSGLVLADLIRNHCNVVVFEKAHSVGGRLATRYNELGHQFDIGAQFFVAKSPQFKQYLQRFIEKKLLQHWHGQFIEIDNNKITRKTKWHDDLPHYIATPKMTSLCKAISDHQQVNLSCRVCKIISKNNRYFLKTNQQLLYGPYSGVIVATPVAQAVELLPKTTNFLSQLNCRLMKGCFAVMLGFKDSIPIDFCAALVKNSDISWISNNTTRPGADKRPPSLTILSTNVFADNHSTCDHKQLMIHLKKVVFNVLKNWHLPDVIFHGLHYWRYANMKKVSGPRSFFDHSQFIGVCGDSYHQGRVEAAYLSALSLSESIKKHIINQ